MNLNELNRGPTEETTRRLAAWLADGPLPALAQPGSGEAWEGLARAAVEAGLAGLLLAAAARRGASLPEAGARRLRWAAAGVAADNVHSMRVLSSVVAALNRAAVPVMLLKGAALNGSVYDRPDLRPMTDLDLLVRFNDAERAVAALEAAGCRRGRPLMRDDFFPRYYYELELLTPPPRAVRIDLHARPFRPLRTAATMPLDALWDGAAVVSLARVPGRSADGAEERTLTADAGAFPREPHAYLPSSESTFIHLAAHAAFHGCDRLIWLHDLTVWVRRQAEFDWEVVVTRCRDWRLSPAVLQALVCAQRWFGEFVPPGVTAALARATVCWRDRFVLRQAPRDASRPFMHLATDLLTMRGLRARMGYLSAYVLPGAGHLGEQYRFRHPGWRLAALAWRGVRGSGGAAAAALLAARGGVFAVVRGLGHVAQRSIVALRTVVVWG
ncbi:MAG: nucleotidyltransferase family protein [Planctomycetes bacterium]|nr:nucleotidyltransferase family protein [Planctomycetota bacterium]